MKISCLLWAFIMVFTSCNFADTKTKISPNIILIVTDDQGWGDLSYHGNQNVATPNLDAIAINGLSMSNFYVQPVCSPTRAEILTGQYFSRLGVYDTSAGGERMDIGVPTLGDIFKSNGYATGAFGKWHNGAQPPYHPNSRGFEEFYGFCSGHWGNYFSPMIEHNGTFTTGNGFLANDLFDRSMEFIEKQNNKPFLVYLPVNTPHSPMQVPDIFWSKFRDKELINRYAGPEQEDEAFTRAALAMVENIDYNVGRLREFLKDRGLEENTILVFMSDNGPNGWRWNGELKGKKGATDEGGVKSPLFIQWPKRIKAGTQLTQIMGSIDILPTLAGLAGIKLNDAVKIDGLGLHAEMLGTKKSQHRRALFNHWNGKTSVRIQDYRLDAENRLYDLRNEHSQTQDLSDKYPKLRDSLVRLKDDWEKLVRAFPGSLDSRPFTLGAQEANFTYLPAQDGTAHGAIQRSNRWPNDSYFTNWKTLQDSITWPVAILNTGTFEVFLHYTCDQENIGAKIELSVNGQQVSKTIDEAFSHPINASRRDIYPRMESDVKVFKRIKFGNLTLIKGQGYLSLKALNIPGKAAVDFRMLEFVKL